MVSVKEIQYKTFGKCLEIKNELVKIIVTLDFGPRVICYSFIEGKNMFFEDNDRVFKECNSTMQEFYGSDDSWVIYGGHRLWKSPETMPETYYPDNEPVSYVLTENGAIFTPPVQKKTNYAYQICITMHESESAVIVEHKVTNHAEKETELAIWPITVMAPGGTEIVPQPTRKTWFSPQMRMTFWDYVDMTDRRLKWLKRYIILKQDAQAQGKMKFGINNEDGFALYFNNGDMFLKEFDVLIDGNYPDGGMTFETYTNPLFLEMESLSELKNIRPRETISHIEKWSLYKQDVPCLNDEDIDRLVSLYKDV